jgi:hypothetical protein
MRHGSACVWTSVGILVAALLRFAERATVLNVLLIVLGIVSILNHMRRDVNTDEWCIRDTLHLFDMLCVVIVGLLMVWEYGLRLTFLIVATVALLVYILLRTNIVPFDLMAPCWASVHLLFILMLFHVR